MMSKDLKGLEGLAAREAMIHHLDGGSNGSKSRVTRMRPRKDTPELIEQLLTYISEGLPMLTACKLSKIGETTFYRWRKEDEEFDKLVKEAQARAEDEMTQVVRNAALAGDSRAAMWRLRFLNPEVYSERLNHEITLKDNKIVETIQAIVDQTNED